MDDDVKEAFDELRAEMREAARARPADRASSERHIREARADLEDVLRENGYRLSRRELDAMIDEREERRFNERLDKALAARAAAEAEEEEGEEEGDEGEAGKKKQAAKKKPAAATEEEEWT